MKLYVAGPMSGLPDLNFPAFFEASALLEAADYEVCNPASFGELPGITWAETLRIDLQGLLTCQGIAVLPGHENSPGAWLEITVGHHLKMPIFPVAHWLREAAPAEPTEGKWSRHCRMDDDYADYSRRQHGGAA